MNTALWIAGLIAGSLLLAAGLIKGAPPRTDAAVELQSGPVILALAAPDKPARLVAVEDCLARRCPLVELRVRRAPAAESRVHITTR